MFLDAVQKNLRQGQCKIYYNRPTLAGGEEKLLQKTDCCPVTFSFKNTSARIHEQQMLYSTIVPRGGGTW